ncbi:hypothetical protein AAB988_26010 [Burkholderia contaminans]|uniref:hypothetical protein n=1 Tax=Burkholderia contaminans TaxID=488447 RepID=UPI0031138548
MGVVAHARRKRIFVGGLACTPQRESRRLGRAERLFIERPHVGVAFEHPVRDAACRPSFKLGPASPKQAFATAKR